jgi:hypothetical protein
MDEQEFFVQQPRSRTYIDFKEVQEQEYFEEDSKPEKAPSAVRD